MKSTFFPVAAIIAGVAAQDLSSLPQCGQTCVNNLIAQGGSRGCNSGNAVCLCSSADFAWGIHDCSAESCPAGTNLGPIIDYGLSYCESAQATATGTTLSALGIFSSVVSTVTSDGSTVTTTTTGSTTHSGTTATTTNSNSTQTESMSSTSRTSGTTTGPVVTTITSDGTTRESTIRSTTSVESSSSSAGAAPGRPVVPGPAAVLVGALRRPALGPAEMLGLGVLGIAGAFWGVGLVEAL